MADTANKIKYGLRNVYYAVATEGEGGALTYGNPVRLPGAVNMSLSPEGNEDPFYADDVIYYLTSTNNGYTGTLELALVPDSFYTDVLGFEQGSDGVMYESADAKGKEFALLFEFQGDAHAVRHALYRCKVARPDVAGATKEDSITPQTETLDLTVMPRINDQLVKSRCPATNTTVYEAWFTAVHEKPTA